MRTLVVLPYLNKHLEEFIVEVNKSKSADFYILGKSNKYRTAFLNDIDYNSIDQVSYSKVLYNLLRKKYTTVIFHGIFYGKMIPLILFLRKSKTIILSESFNPHKNNWLSTLAKKIYVTAFNLGSGNTQLVALGSKKTKDQYEQLGLRLNNFHKSAYLPKLQGCFNKNKKRVNNKIQLAFIGQFIERKNIDMLIKLVLSKEWAKLIGEVEIYLIGDGKLEGSLDVPNNVKILYAQGHNQVLDKLEEIDVLLLPSYFDGWGAVVNEAISRGCALLLSPQVGAGEMFLKNGENGYLISVDNYLDIIVRIAKWIETPLLLERMQSKSFELFEKLHNPETQYDFLI